MKPLHIGDILDRDVIKPLGLSKREAAEALGISRGHLGRILNGQCRITAAIAFRFEQVFDIRMEYVLEHQLRHDIDNLRRKASNGRARRFQPTQLSLPAL